MKRYTLDVNNETWKTIKQMQVETGVGSVTDVIQDSLRTYAYLIEEQKQAIEKLKEEEKELREKGELIYHKYNLINGILEEINKASKKYPWKEIKEKLKGHNIIKEFNEKDRKIVVETN